MCVLLVRETLEEWEFERLEGVVEDGMADALGTEVVDCDSDALPAGGLKHEGAERGANSRSKKW